jgi:UDP-N-acetylmuramate dehydrogenase
VSGATLLDHLARWAVGAGLEGVNMCSGIPGTVGGAVIGNAGAFGRQIGDVLESVLLMDPQGTVSRCPAQDLELAYRRTRLQAGGEVVLSARLRLVPGDAVRLQTEREEILALRREKHPDWHREPCIGSIFRNIEPTSKAGRRQAAGWFLEQAGVKDMRVGGAFIYPKHANIIVRDPQGTASDVHDLSLRMAEAVQTRFGLRLEREVRFLGDFSDGSGGDRPAVFH